jgi:hypothetical protein
MTMPGKGSGESLEKMSECLPRATSLFRELSLIGPPSGQGGCPRGIHKA